MHHFLLLLQPLCSKSGKNMLSNLIVFSLSVSVSRGIYIFIFLGWLLLEGGIQGKGSVIVNNQWSNSSYGKTHNKWAWDQRLWFFHHFFLQQWKVREQGKADHELNYSVKYLFSAVTYSSSQVCYPGTQRVAYQGNVYLRLIQMCSLDCGRSMTSSLLKGPGQVMSDFNSHSHRLASPAFWRPIKPDSSPF